MIKIEKIKDINKFVFLGILILGISGQGWACGLPIVPVNESVLKGEDTEARGAEIKRLRDAGPAGFRQALSSYQQMVRDGGERSELSRMEFALGQIAGQKDAHVSGLFWFTDWDEAKKRAQERQLPILSLRLLGRLDEDLSCANSRFFRTTLYPNQKVMKLLSERFVLHWKSVRPVPVVTIDFGDGRQLQRTLTGNSIHYVLASNGSVIDGIPGLYHAEGFLAELNRCLSLYERIQNSGDFDLVRTFHQDRARVLTAEFGEMLEQGGLPKDLTPSDLEEEQWNVLAALKAKGELLDLGTMAFLSSKSFPAESGQEITVSKMVVERPIMKVVRDLTRHIEQDTIRNQFVRHLQIHRWLGGRKFDEVDVLNERVYAQLFYMPHTDPWLGLDAGGSFSALDDGGKISESYKGVNY